MIWMCKMSKKNIRPTLGDKILKAQGLPVPPDYPVFKNNNTALDDMMLKCRLEKEIYDLEDQIVGLQLSLTNVEIRMRLKAYPDLEE